MTNLPVFLKMSLIIALFTGIAGSLAACNNNPSNNGYDIPVERERRGSY